MNTIKFEIDEKWLDEFDAVLIKRTRNKSGCKGLEIKFIDDHSASYQSSDYKYLGETK